MEHYKDWITASTNDRGDKWDTVLLGGLLGSMFSLLQFFVSPMIGRASDRMGRRRVLLLTMVCYVKIYEGWGKKSLTTMMMIGWQFAVFCHVDIRTIIFHVPVGSYCCRFERRQCAAQYCHHFGRDRTREKIKAFGKSTGL